MTELSKIASKYYTDKGITYFNSHGYTEIYDSYFKKLKNENRKVNILEIGVQAGYDLLMLNDYFEGNCEIYGIDIDLSTCKIKDNLPENIHLIKMNGSNIDELASWYNNSIKLNYESVFHIPLFDIILDDGSHYSEDIINTLIFFYDKISNNGLYIIEDLHAPQASEILNYLTITDINNIPNEQLRYVLSKRTNMFINYIYDNSNIEFNSSIFTILQFKR